MSTVRQVFGFNVHDSITAVQVAAGPFPDCAEHCTAPAQQPPVYSRRNHSSGSRRVLVFCLELLQKPMTKQLKGQGGYLNSQPVTVRHGGKRGTVRAGSSWSHHIHNLEMGGMSACVCSAPFPVMLSLGCPV